VASLYFIVSWVASRKAIALQTAQAVLIRAKDEQLATDLKNKDVSISVADQNAADAKAKTTQLEHDNLQLKTDLQIATADSRAKQAELATEQAKLATEQRTTAEAQREAAEAQLALKEHLERVAKRQAWRSLDSKSFVEALQGKPKAKVQIWYKPEDAEAQALAREIYSCLIQANWVASWPDPIPPNAVRKSDFGDLPEESLLKLSTLERVGGHPTGVTLIANDISPTNSTDTPIGALFQALISVLQEAGSSRDPGLPNDLLRLVVGAKP
jgi:hypothetical protein